MALRKKQKSLLLESYIYIVASILSAALPFLLLPILTSYIPPDEFAQIGIFQGLYTAFLPLCGLGVGSAIVRQSYDSNQDEIGSYIFNSILIMLGSTFVLLLLITLLREQIGSALETTISVVYLSVFAAAAMFIYNVYLGQCQVNQMARRFGIMQVSYSFTNVGLSLLFVVGLSMGVAGRIWGVTGAGIAFCCIAFAGLVLMGRINPVVNKTDMRGALRFGLPLIPHELGTFFTNWFGVILLNTMLPAAEVGIYTLAFYAAMAVGLLCDAFNRAFVPWLFAKLKTNKPEERADIVALTWKYFGVMAVISLLAFPLGPLIIDLFFDAAYATAGTYIGWLVTGQALGGCYLMVTNYITYQRRTEVISFITIVASSLNVALLFAVVPVYGVAGAVFAFVFTRALIFTLTFGFANWVLPMPWLSAFPMRSQSGL